MYISCLLLAVMSLSMKMLSTSLTTAAIIFFRCLIPVLMFAPVLVTQPESRRQLSQERSSLLARGGFGAISLLCYVLAVRQIPVSEVNLTTNTTPIWAALSAYFSLGEAIQPRLLYTFPLSFLGVFLVARGSLQGAWLGYLCGLGSAIFAGLAYTYIRKVRHIEPRLIALSFLSIACLSSLPMLLAQGFTHGSLPPSIMLILVMGVCGGLGQWFMTLGYRYNTAAVAASLSLAQIAFTVLLGMLILGERFTSTQWAGVLLVLAGTWLSRERT
jgi:drug/metabolite transporter (DMT)-like permease